MNKPNYANQFRKPNNQVDAALIEKCIELKNKFDCSAKAWEELFAIESQLIKRDLLIPAFYSED